MPRRRVVDQLPEEQRDFFIALHLSGATDREVSAQFFQRFGKPLAKSSISRWRSSVGGELQARYDLVRRLAKQVVENVKRDGSGAADKWQIILEDLEDRLLIATRDVINADPIKVLQVRQAEELRRLRERELDLKEEDLKLRRERQEAEARTKTDRFGVAADFWKFQLGWFLKNSPGVADSLAAHSEELLAEFGQQIGG